MTDLVSCFLPHKPKSDAMERRAKTKNQVCHREAPQAEVRRHGAAERKPKTKSVTAKPHKPKSDAMERRAKTKNQVCHREAPSLSPRSP